VGEVAGAGPGSHYHDSERFEEDALHNAMPKLVSQWPTFGQRHISSELRRTGWAVTCRRIAIVLAQVGLPARTSIERRQKTDRGSLE
jgi:hypothetical protein